MIIIVFMIIIVMLIIIVIIIIIVVVAIPCVLFHCFQSSVLLPLQFPSTFQLGCVYNRSYNYFQPIISIISFVFCLLFHSYVYS